MAQYKVGSGPKPAWTMYLRYTAVQSQKAVSAHFASKQILPFVFAEQYTFPCGDTWQVDGVFMAAVSCGQPW